MQVDLSALTPAQYKQTLKVMQAEQRKRGPSGSLKLDEKAIPEIAALVAQIAQVGNQQQSNAVEVIDACLRFLGSEFYLSTKKRDKAEPSAGKEVTV